ncbi:uncharacterized protein LOC127258441 [Andrographis paniculata]|uniref:uncharacterized protein LOC127258441 n=1 Tax=Andrographis paniculata TaxID=175694 RepID=UPI0021E7BB58|nr:uncharacterized protein LOC127258441 [Andrographis paniculata]
MKLQSQTVFFMFWFLLATASADILQNPDFERPPSNWRATSTAQFFPLDENSTTLPGWTFLGKVEYVTAGSNLSLPRNGHAILLADEGKINQTFTASGERAQYILTFAVARGIQDCSTNASLVVSAPDSTVEFSVSGKYGKQPWQVYGHYIGSWGDGESVNLVIQSQAVDSESNSTCWPVVGDLSLLAITSSSIKVKDKDNLLQNGGFELGPAFLESSNEGVLMDSEPSLTESALEQWTILGTVKYVDAKNFFVPEGKAAVEILGASAGVQTAKQLTRGSEYNLQFMLGDANDSCSGDFVVGVAAGSSAQNFTVHSNGTGSAKKYSLKFKGDGESTTSISFQGYTTSQRKDGVFCGPMVDAVVLTESRGCRCKPKMGSVLVGLLLVALFKLFELI